MSKRFTDTGKWTDKWFRKLSVCEKLLFLWLVDNCDNAGFWEVDLELAALQIGMTEGDVLGAWQGLRRAYIEHGEYVWVKRFIRVQGNCPLNPENNAHKQILALFQEHADFGIDFESAMRNDSKNSPSLGPKEAPCNGRGRSKGNGHGKSKGKRARGNFIPPTLDEVKKYVADNPELSNVDPVGFWKGFNDGDWIDTQGNPVRNWKLKLRTWSDMAHERKTTKNSQQQGASSSGGQQNRPARRDTSEGSNIGGSVEA